MITFKEAFIGLCIVVLIPLVCGFVTGFVNAAMRRFKKK